ncbi:helix-turn-helix domain-containing protein [Kineosporia succinea]|uniref:HTH cro/C1-type domain-containing protein n=1 Tax=Kineosporia succinea TaxID=84632 RepID=A0ABT9P6W9_9ACTN|nr:helix-turn-helix transcriptional regulator [Kineosporia succinea]MDP9827810.1 hypothetical protein [Kineosporia succinea]
MDEQAGQDSLAAMLLTLKERSGLSYGVLARRLHSSTSTLHRYCNGETVPLEFAPVERFARLCKASPTELAELNRRWADALERRARRDDSAAPGDQLEDASAPVPDAGAGVPAAGLANDGQSRSGLANDGQSPSGLASDGQSRSGLANDGLSRADDAVASVAPVPGSRDDHHPESGVDTEDSMQTDGAASGPHPTETISSPPVPSARRRRFGALAVVGAVALAVGVPLGVLNVVNGSSSGTPGGDGATPVTAPSTVGPPAPLDVLVTPFTLCARDILVDSTADQVPPPVDVPDTSAWVSALDGVVTHHHDLTVTVQGTGNDTVVLESLNVRTVESKETPTAGNVFVLGDGCGGKVDTAIFDVNLDMPQPKPRSAAGNTLPLKTSSSDPVQLQVAAVVEKHDVSWYLELDWSSGGRHGTLRIDDHGKPFRTTGVPGRPHYYWMYDQREWKYYPD